MNESAGGIIFIYRAGAIDEVIKAVNLTVCGVGIFVYLGFIIPYFLDVVKFIIYVFNGKSVTVGNCVELAVVEIITVTCRLSSLYYSEKYSRPPVEQMVFYRTIRI